MSIELIKLKGVRNIRDLSQYQAADNKKIKKHSFIRSAKLHKVKRKRLYKFLNEYNIKTIIDLRTTLEVEENKKVIYPADVKYIHLPVLDQAYFGITHEKSMRTALYNQSKKMEGKDSYYNYMVDMYKGIVFDEYSQNKFKEFFDILLNNTSGNILFHCAGGKDRTGIASLFILTLLGVDKDIILDDYSMSDIVNKRHNRTIECFLKLLWNKSYRRLLSEMLYAKREYLEKTIESIEEKYNSVSDYLEKVLDISKEKQEKFKSMYLELS